jgi:hypothetical protein
MTFYEWLEAFGNCGAGMFIALLIAARWFQ